MGPTIRSVTGFPPHPPPIPNPFQSKSPLPEHLIQLCHVLSRDEAGNLRRNPFPETDAVYEALVSLDR